MASEKTRGAPKRQGKKPKAAAIAKAAKKADKRKGGFPIDATNHLRFIRHV